MNGVFIEVTVIDIMGEYPTKKRHIAVSTIVSLETYLTSDTKFDLRTDKVVTREPIPYTELVTINNYSHTIAETPEDVKQAILRAIIKQGLDYTEERLKEQS